MRKYLILACLVQLLWSLTPSASQVVIASMPVEIYIALRWTISGVALSTILITTQGWAGLPDVSDLPALFLLGVFGFAISSFVGLWGLKLGGVVHFALISALAPLLRSLLWIAVIRQKTERAFWYWSAGCVVSLIILTQQESMGSQGRSAIVSTGLILIAYLLEALTYVFSYRLKARYSLLAYMAALQVSAAIATWMLLLCWRRPLLPNAPPLRAWLSLGYVSLVSCGLCYFLFYWLLNFIDGHRLSFFDSLHSVFAAFWGWLFFHESPGAIQLVAGACLLYCLVRLNEVPVEPATVPHSSLSDNLPGPTSWPKSGSSASQSI